MAKRRRLADLYQVGKTLTFDDGGGEIEIWLQKPNGVEQEAIFRRANAATLRFVRQGENPESDEFADALDVIAQFDDDETVIRLALSEEFAKIRARIEAQLVAGEDSEWAKDDYYQSVIDAWHGDDDNDGLKKTYALDPEDTEALACFNELARFNDAVAEAYDAESVSLIAEARTRPWGEVEAQAAKIYVKSTSNDFFMKEYERQFTYYSLRDPDDHLKRYFGTLAEVDELSDVIRKRLSVEINSIMLEASEGKDSPATPDGSPPSEPVETEETSEASGLEVSPT